MSKNESDQDLAEQVSIFLQSPRGIILVGVIAVGIVGGLIYSIVNGALA